MSKLGNRPQSAPQRRTKPLPKPDAMPPHPLGEGRVWLPYAQQYWDRVWEADARYYWEESDLLLLDRCLIMVEQIALGESSIATLSELRRTEEALYLSPGSRQRSRISTTEAAKDQPEDDLERRRKERAALLSEG